MSLLELIGRLIKYGMSMLQRRHNRRLSAEKLKVSKENADRGTKNQPHIYNSPKIGSFCLDSCDTDVLKLIFNILIE